MLPALLLAAAASAPPDPFLLQYAETRGFLAGRPTAIAMAPDGKAVLFLRSGPRSPVQALWELSLAGGAPAERLLVDPARLPAAVAPTAAEAARLERQRIGARGLTGFELSRDGSIVAFSVGGRLFVHDRARGSTRALPAGDGVLAPRLAPDARAVAFVRRRDVWVLELARGAPRRLTRARGPAVTNGVAEFVAQEEMGRQDGLWWSPDARRVAFAEVDESRVERLADCDPARPEAPCEEVRYPRAGTENARVRLGIAPARGGAPVFARWDADRFPYLATVKWERGGPLTIVVQDRRQRVEQVRAVDAETGETRLLLEERDDAWVNLHPRFPLWKPDGTGFFWLTERGGAPEVELRAPGGERIGVAVPAAARFVKLAGFGRADGTLWFVAAPDPTREVLYRVRPGAPPAPVPLDDGDPGLRWARLAEAGNAVAVTVETSRRLPRTTVHGPDGARLAEVASVAEEPPFAPAAEIRKLGPGDGLWTALIRPRTARTARLPVLVQVYGGPVHLGDPPLVSHRPMLLGQWLADRGFAVVVVDGRGTPRRGRAFERAIRGDLSKATLEDQVAGLRAIAAEAPDLDLARVGILGWSFGGYMAALAVLDRPDVFGAAVAGAPVSEWREYDTHYAERYLGLPSEDAAAYERSSLLARAASLARPLLVVHGTADDNVHLVHSLRLADAAFRAGRPPAFLPIAGAKHVPREPLAAARLWERTAAFLEEALARP